MEDEQAIIPGLPDDIAIDCIALIPQRFHPALRPVSRRWRDLVISPFFRHRREIIGSVEDLIFLVQAVVVAGGHADADAAEAEPKREGKPNDLQPPVYAISLYCPTDGSWHRLVLPEPIPMFAQCVIADGKLVILGGWDPTTLNPVVDVRILDLMTGEWRKGRPMSTMRSFFECAAAGGKVYAAGGHDEMKNALRTAEAYDVKADEWVALPPMTEERDECQGVAIGGEFWAISGYGTERQGGFESSVECFSPVRKEWVRKEGVWSEEWGSAACCGGGGAVGLWCVRSRDVREYRAASGWTEVAPTPKGMHGCACIAAMGGGKGVERVFVMGGGQDEGSGYGYGGWVLDIGIGMWRRMETPGMFSGFAYSAAAVRL